MATKKRTTTRSTSAKAKPAARTNARPKAKRAHPESAKGIVYTSVLRELMASRLAKG